MKVLFKFKFFNKSIRTKMLFLFLITYILSIAIVGYLGYYNARNALQDEIFNELSGIAVLKERDIEDFFANRKKDVKVAQQFKSIQTYLPILIKHKKNKTNPEYINAKNQIDYQLNAFQPTDDVYREIELIDPTGEIVYVSSLVHQGEVGLMMTDRIEFREGKNRIYMGDIFYDEIYGDFEIYMAAPIKDSGGNFIGEIFFETPMVKINTLMHDMTGLSETFETYLVGRDMLMRSQSRYFEDNTILKTWVNTEGTDDCFNKPTREESPVQHATIYKNYRGTRVIGSYKLLKEVDWCLLAEIDETKAFAQINTLKMMTLTILGIASILSAIIALYLASAIIDPIEELVNGTEKIGKGDLDYKIMIKRDDEIGRLSDSFNQMTEDLKRSKEKIEEYSRNLEQKVDDRTRELKRSNKLKDLFIDIIRHDILNPAGVARNLSQMILENEEHPKKKEILQVIYRSNESIIEMIGNASDLQTLESGEKLEFEDIDIGIVLKKSVREVVRLADAKNIEIKLATHGEFKAMANPLIHDVFLNLLTNAIKYSPEKSVVDVRIMEEGSNWKISVADNGEGIDNKDKEAIFDRFNRIHKGAVKGSGLGLAIVKKIIELHNGRVWVEDNSDGGSIFFVTLPKD